MGDISRNLTLGERRVAASIFGDAIDYRRVRVHNYRAYPFQSSDTAVTPNGELYFPKAVYRTDFSTDRANASWFIHEMTHVWQHQQGMWLRTRAVFNHRYPYGELNGKSPTPQAWGVEQQASIVADYFLIRHGGKPTEGSGPIAAYERVIPFLPGKAG